MTMLQFSNSNHLNWVYTSFITPLLFILLFVQLSMLVEHSSKVFSALNLILADFTIKVCTSK